jgi:hypothetical protein
MKAPGFMPGVISMRDFNPQHKVGGFQIDSVLSFGSIFVQAMLLDIGHHGLELEAIKA